MQSDPPDLSKWTMPPEALAAYYRTATPTKPSARRQRTRVEGEFYLVPRGWADRAAVAVISAQQLIMALRLYRRWRTRRQGEETITVSQSAVGGPGFSYQAKRRALGRLASAGLIEVVSGGVGRASRVRVIE
jgi:hypothetical protein